MISARFHFTVQLPLMSYQTYTTKAVVCGSYLNGAADKSYLLFTRDAGMLYATARSVREERSRQRYALQDFSYLTISLIKGKGGWRVGSVEVMENFYSQLTTRESRGVLVRYIKHLRRYISGEVADQVLYQEVVTAITEVAQVPTPALPVYESLIYARLLTRLGYIAPPASLVPFLGLGTNFSLEVAPFDLARIEQLITQAEEVSHL